MPTVSVDKYNNNSSAESAAIVARRSHRNILHSSGKQSNGGANSISICCSGRARLSAWPNCPRVDFRLASGCTRIGCFHHSVGSAGIIEPRNGKQLEYSCRAYNGSVMPHRRLPPAFAPMCVCGRVRTGAPPSECMCGLQMAGRSG